MKENIGKSITGTQRIRVAHFVDEVQITLEEYLAVKKVFGKPKYLKSDLLILWDERWRK